jgi:hypothetical protein
MLNILQLTDAAVKKDHKLNLQYIKIIKLANAIEHGGKSDTIHAHILFKVVHYINLSRKYSEIKQKIQDHKTTQYLYVQQALQECR